MEKYLVTIEFRYTIRAKNEKKFKHLKTKTITIGVFDTQDEAIEEGNKNLEAFPVL